MSPNGSEANLGIPTHLKFVEASLKARFIRDSRFGSPSLRRQVVVPTRPSIRFTCGLRIDVMELEAEATPGC